MNVNDLKEKYNCRIGAVYCEHAKRVAFFRQPLREEFQAVQLATNSTDIDLRVQGQEEYVATCFVGSAAIPDDPNHKAEDFVVVPNEGPGAEPWYDRIIHAEGVAIVSNAFVKCVNDLGGGTAKRTRFF